MKGLEKILFVITYCLIALTVFGLVVMVFYATLFNGKHFFIEYHKYLMLPLVLGLFIAVIGFGLSLFSPSK